MVWPTLGQTGAVPILIVTYLIVAAIAALPYIADYLGRRPLESGGAGEADGLPDGGARALMQAVHDRCRRLACIHGLTERELEVFELLVRGKTRANIQDLLFISESTVKTHIKHIYAKFDVGTVTELMDVVFDGADGQGVEDDRGQQGA